MLGLVIFLGRNWCSWFLVLVFLYCFCGFCFFLLGFLGLPGFVLRNLLISGLAKVLKQIQGSGFANVWCLQGFLVFDVFFWMVSIGQFLSGFLGMF